MSSPKPYMGMRLGTPVQPSDENSRNDPFAAIEGRFNRGTGEG